MKYYYIKLTIKYSEDSDKEIQYLKLNDENFSYLDYVISEPIIIKKFFKGPHGTYLDLDTSQLSYSFIKDKELIRLLDNKIIKPPYDIMYRITKTISHASSTSSRHNSIDTINNSKNNKYSQHGSQKERSLKYKNSLNTLNTSKLLRSENSYEVNETRKLYTSTPKSFNSSIKDNENLEENKPKGSFRNRGFKFRIKSFRRHVDVDEGDDIHYQIALLIKLINSPDEFMEKIMNLENLLAILQDSEILEYTLDLMAHNIKFYNQMMLVSKKRKCYDYLFETNDIVLEYGGFRKYRDMNK